MRDYPGDRVDLRSDTVTQPTPPMREAMAGAKVGDDVWGDDPTVIQLQEMVAEILGKEESLFVPSGTMSNTIAIKAQTNHCLLYTSPSPRDVSSSRMPSSA